MFSIYLTCYMLRKMIDLKSYFSQASSGSRPSTHASGVCNEPGIQVEVQENKWIVIKMTIK
jgi:hypothetical protein